MRNRLANFVFRMIDAFLELSTAFRKAPGPTRPIDRILIANGAHLGDVIMSTAVLPAIKARFPEARIGMLVGSWSRAVVDNHPLVDWVHTVDHWRMSRSDAGLVARIGSYYRTRRRALKNIRELRYDAAIDLYFYFPNSIILLWQTGIPIRIGYDSAGFGPLLTEPSPLVLRDSHMLTHHHHLLQCLWAEPPLNVESLKPLLFPRPSRPRRLSELGYIVVHLGSGSLLKDWPQAHWRTLLEALCADRRYQLIFTGHGRREQELVRTVSKGLEFCLDLCGLLNWDEFVEVIAAAEVLVGVDSASAHVAAAVNTPSVTVGHGMNNLSLWQPVSPFSTVLRHNVPCSPCYRKDGCATMDCIRQVDPAQVYDEVMRRLGDSSVSPPSA